MYVAVGPAYYDLHPQKELTICIFLTYQSFKSQEGIICRTRLTERYKIVNFELKNTKSDQSD